MRFGLCCSYEEVTGALDAGFDYVELAASRLREQTSELSGVPVEATNLFFPSGFQLFGPGADDAPAYGSKLFPIAASLGVRTMVIGSGAARRAAAEQKADLAQSEFCRIASELSKMASEYGIVVAPESLNATETDVGNRLSSLARELASLGTAYTADSYHVLAEWRSDHGTDWHPSSVDWAVELPTRPAHVHLASAERQAPQPGDASLAGFVQRLAELGYDGRVSLECSVKEAGMAQALRGAKSLFGC